MAVTAPDYLRARYYDPSTGQFISRDAAVGTTRAPYSYAANNPLNFTDPSGLCLGGDGWICIPTSFGEASQNFINNVQTPVGEALAAVGGGALIAAGGIAATGLAMSGGAALAGLGGSAMTARMVSQSSTYFDEESSSTSGLGDIGGGASTVTSCLQQAQRWLGDKYSQIAPGIYRSADNARQFRMTDDDLGSAAPHVHYEAIAPNGRTIVENSHVYLEDR